MLIKISENIMSWIKNNIPLIIMTIFLVVFIFLGFKKPLWLDEFFTIQVIKYDLPTQIISKLYNGADTNAPLYFIVLKIYTSIFGLTVFTLKSFSVFFILCSLLLSYKIFQMLFGNKKISNILVFFLSILSPISTYLLVEIRTYSFFIFEEILFMYLYLKYKNIASKRLLFFLLINSILLIYTHYFAVLFLGTFLIYEIFQPKKDMRLILIFLLSFLTFIPWLNALSNQIKIGHGVIWQEVPGLKDIYITYSFLLGRSGLLILILAVCYIILRWKYFKNYLQLLFLGILLTLIPVVNIILASLNLSVHTPRYYLASIFGMLIIIGSVLQVILKDKKHYFIFLSIIVALGFYRVYRYSKIIDETESTISNYISLSSKNINIVCESPHLFYPLDYYSMGDKGNFYFVLDSLSSFDSRNIKNAPYDYYLIRNYLKYYKINHVVELNEFLKNNLQFYLIDEKDRMLFEDRFENNSKFNITLIKDNIYLIKQNEI